MLRATYSVACCVKLPMVLDMLSVSAHLGDDLCACNGRPAHTDQLKDKNAVGSLFIFVPNIGV